MATDDGETFAQLIRALMDAYRVSLSDIARAIDVSPGTVSTWASGKRGTGRGPRPDKLRALARAFPRFTEERIFASVGRRAPGPLSPEAEERLLELFRRLTAEQQQLTELQMRAIADSNENGAA